MLLLGTGTVAVDAHTSLLTLCEFTFITVPFGIATATTIRVGNMLGANRPGAAKRAGERFLTHFVLNYRLSMRQSRRCMKVVTCYLLSPSQCLLFCFHMRLFVVSTDIHLPLPSQLPSHQDL